MAFVSSSGTNGSGKASKHDRFFFSLTLVMLIVVFLGFAPTYYLDSFFETAIEFQPMPGYLTIHAFILSLWFVGQVVQSALVQTGHRDIHRIAGVIATGVAAGVFITGIVVTAYAVPHAEDFGITPRARLNVLVVSNTMNLVVFAILVSLALHFRFRPQYHKRLMLIASIAIIGPAVSPFRALGKILGTLLPQSVSIPVPLLFWIVLVASIGLHDWSVSGRIHRATLWGGGMKIAASVITLSLVHSGVAGSYVNFIDSWLD